MIWDRATQQALPSVEVTHFHLMRHGRVDTGGRRLAYGHEDLPLSDEGRRQGELLVQFAQDHLPRPDGVISSDLQRCTAIAGPLSKALGLPLQLTPALREQSMGDWEGRAWADLTEADITGVRQFWTDYVDTRPPNGESYADMADRVTAWMNRQQEELRGRRWLVVTHVGVIRCIVCRSLGLPLKDALRITPVHGSHTWLMMAEAGSVLQTLGERSTTGPSSPTEAARRRQRASTLSRPLRLALSGSAGTGKSTLGEALGEQLDLPYIPEGMRRRIESGFDLHTLSHDGFRSLLWELWREQQQAENQAIEAHGGFIADRSSVDYAAFWLSYGFSDHQEETESFFAEVLAHVERYDRIIAVPWGVVPLKSDGVRSSNPWLQRAYQATVEGLLHRESAEGQVVWLPPLVDLESRVEWVCDVLKETGAREAGAPWSLTP